ncbi:hypothetical protein LCGC14_2797370 [marine sediment metagenome]|uniref:Uncharacterized protein n=1 Tax=marine sediment metagenome TaxID=412755 RepID=A0A0F8ZAT4_9ZZZZ
MFDSLLMLLDGTIDLAPSTDTAATSTTRSGATGAAVIDLGTGGTPASGLSCVLILPAASADEDILTAFLEVSSVVAFGSDVSEMGKFDIAAATKGVILGSETPAVVILRFSTDKRYVRFNGTVTASDDFKAVKCFLTPSAFKVI